MRSRRYSHGVIKGNDFFNDAPFNSTWQCKHRLGQLVVDGRIAAICYRRLFGETRVEGRLELFVCNKVVNFTCNMQANIVNQPLTLDSPINSGENIIFHLALESSESKAFAVNLLC